VRDVVVAVLLGVAGVSVVISCLGVLVMRDPLDRLHFTAPAGVLAPVAVAAAVLVEEPLSSAGIKAVVIALIMLATGPILLHATARAARIRERGRWVLLRKEVDAKEEPSRSSKP
jgi:multicomponent Na+:H+ antiporter subunit G